VRKNTRRPPVPNEGSTQRHGDTEEERLFNWIYFLGVSVFSYHRTVKLKCTPKSGLLKGLMMFSMIAVSRT